MRKICLLFLLLAFNTLGQSIHQQELEFYNASGLTEATDYENKSAIVANQTKAGCNLDHVVYGWHPYWSGSAYQNYQWDLLSHFSFFSYEVVASTGEASTTHGWSTSAAVDAALASGNTKVTLCVTLFSGHTTFFGSPTAQQTLITNLINLVQSRGAHGVNIDFEGLPSAQKTNFANFMVSLANQMHTAIPGSEVSTVLYSVDWNDVFDFSIMEPEVDHYIIMGYGYYYSGSSTAGPTDPLYQFGNSYNYTLSKSITNYLDNGCPTNKLIMGLPNYGYEWPTSSLTVPSSTSGSGSSKTYRQVRNNTSGNYSTGNHLWDADSYTDIYAFNASGQDRQCFITKEDGFDKRLDHIRKTGIGGIGIWALGYDDGYSDLWNKMRTYLTDCYQDPCSGDIHDFGGPTKKYYNNEDYTWTIAPPGASQITVDFSSFDVEANYDYLYIYDGATTASPQIAGSPFTGTNSPGSFVTTSGAITFRFTSDGATVTPGFNATYTCDQDNVVPITSINPGLNWETTNFSASFNDSDNESVETSYSLVADFDGTRWDANADSGYVYQDFNQISLGAEWTNTAGSWSIQSDKLNQSDEVTTNTILSMPQVQTLGYKYIYKWNGSIGGGGTNRRAGLHFFCSDPSLSNRGDSYLVYWRVDTDKCQIYKCEANAINLQTDDDVVVDPNTEYEFMISYDPQTGVIEAYLNGVLSSTWTDLVPLTTGVYLSPRTGNCTMTMDELQVYKSRFGTQEISINTNGLIRFQNPDPLNPSGKILSVVRDANRNFSTVSVLDKNVDWTIPLDFAVSDGLSTDIDLTSNSTQLSANWLSSTDPNSGIEAYLISAGTSPGASNIFPETNIGNVDQYTISGLTLIDGTTYYITLKSVNGAGLISNQNVSDGQLYQQPVANPVAEFELANGIVCIGDSLQLINNSEGATSYTWSSSLGQINDPTAENPYLTITQSGNYSIILTVSNTMGGDAISHSYDITAESGPVADAIPDQTTVNLPNAVVLFQNTSTNASTYLWDFGDGSTSTDSNPWHEFNAIGEYVVMLVAYGSTCGVDTTYFTINVGSLGTIELEPEAIIVYPNPFENELYVNVKDIVPEDLQLIDIHGKKIKITSYIIDKDKYKIKMDKLVAGVYFLQMGSGRNVKLVKQ